MKANKTNLTKEQIKKLIEDKQIEKGVKASAKKRSKDLIKEQMRVKKLNKLNADKQKEEGRKTLHFNRTNNRVGKKRGAMARKLARTEANKARAAALREKAMKIQQERQDQLAKIEMREKELEQISDRRIAGEDLNT